MISSSNTMPALGQPMPGRLHADRLALEGAGVAEHAALGVDLAESVVEERLGDVLGSERVAGAEDVGGVVAGLGTQMDRHGAERIRSRRYFRNLLVVLSASTLPPVWHVGQ